MLEQERAERATLDEQAGDEDIPAEVEDQRADRE
jgi:hypothetical protein